MRSRECHSRPGCSPRRLLPLRSPGSSRGRRRRHGRPAHFVSDRARCFRGQVFRRKLRRLGVKQRFGAVGKKGSIALIERLWRTLKDTLGLRLLRPLGSGRSRRDGRARPPPLRALPPASGNRWCDTGRGLFRTDARASLRDPASSRQARRRPDGSHRSESSTSTRNDYCRCWFEKQPEERSRKPSEERWSV